VVASPHDGGLVDETETLDGVTGVSSACLDTNVVLSTRSTSLPESKRDIALLHALRDEELVELFVRGDDTAYTVLYQRYSARLLGYVHSLLGADEPAADDLFQETFLRLWRERDRCRKRESSPITNAGGWLFRVARNLALNHLRSRSYLTHLPSAVDELLAVPVEEAHATLFGRAQQEEELLKAVGAVVDTLPVALREVFVLREVNGLSYRETAAIVGCSEEAARMRLSRARGAIRAALKYVTRGEG